MENKNNKLTYIALGLICFAIGFACAIMYNLYIRDDNSVDDTSNEKTSSVTTTITESSEDSELIEALNNYLNKYVKQGIIKNVQIKLTKEMDKSEYCNSSIDKYGSNYKNQIQRGAVITYDLVDGNDLVGINYVVTGNDEIVGDHIEAGGVFVFEKTNDTYRVINLWTGCGEE